MEALPSDPFKLLVQSIVDYAIYMLDPKGFVTSWNAGAERIKGFQTEEIVGQHFSTFYTEEDREAGMPQKVLETARSEGKFAGEGWRVRKDGIALLGERRRRPDQRREGQADRLRQDHSRHDRAARRRSRRCSKPSGASGSSSRASPITRSSCSIPKGG